MRSAVRGCSVIQARSRSRVFSYIVAHDSGFAPNPFHGCCTLACCKPVIRRTAQEGDWVVGLSPRGETIIYAMQVQKVLPFADYWRAHPKKRPRWFSKDERLRVGDNVYKPLGKGRFEQQPSCHSHPNGRPNRRTSATDLGGNNVLVSRRFVYFGSKAQPRPPELEFLVVGRGHRKTKEVEHLRTFERWFARQRRGRRGPPMLTPSPATARRTGRCG